MREWKFHLTAVFGVEPLGGEYGISVMSVKPRDWILVTLLRQKKKELCRFFSSYDIPSHLGTLSGGRSSLEPCTSRTVNPNKLFFSYNLVCGIGLLPAEI